MQVSPKIRVCPFTDLLPGEFFLFSHAEGRCVGFVAEYNDRKQIENVAFSLGPDLIPGIGRKLFKHHLTAMSFGKDLRLVLPTAPSHWEYEQRRDADQFLIVVEQKVYLIATGFAGDYHSIDTFIDMQDGKILLGQNGIFVRPPGSPAFPMEWSLTTVETKPRVIFSYP